MKLNDYQKQAMRTAIFPARDGYIYTALGLSGEAGEIANKVKKFVRDGYTREELPYKLNEVRAELGDVLWYVAAMAEVLETDLETIADTNLKKLQSRKERGKLSGDGDDR
jgi:NTP pyrophosphatase (non-canonical NTP hydrolase)